MGNGDLAALVSRPSKGSLGFIGLAEDGAGTLTAPQAIPFRRSTPTPPLGPSGPRSASCDATVGFESPEHPSAPTIVRTQQDVPIRMRTSRQLLEEDNAAVVSNRAANCRTHYPK